MTYLEMCTTIAEHLNANPDAPRPEILRGRILTGEDIWNMSPTGELWPIHQLWKECPALSSSTK